MGSRAPDTSLLGSPAAWLAALAVGGCAALYAGWTPWLGRFAQLASAYALAHLVFVLGRDFLVRLDMRREILVAVLASALGAIIATGAFRGINDAMRVPNAGMGFDAGVAVAFVAILLLAGILQRDAVARATQDRLLAELRLSALQAQVEPHFLYNTLANVQQLVRSDAVAADQMLESLIRYLKTSIPQVRSGRSTLGQELERAEAYLSIMGIRMESRLTYELDAPEALREVAVPPLSVMTLVENAVKHGLERRPGGGRVTITCRNQDGALVIRVVDDGMGFGSETGSGMGLANLRERLASLHGERARLELSHGSPSGVEASLVLPLG